VVNHISFCCISFYTIYRVKRCPSERNSVVHAAKRTGRKKRTWLNYIPAHRGVNFRRDKYVGRYIAKKKWCWALYNGAPTKGGPELHHVPVLHAWNLSGVPWNRNHASRWDSAKERKWERKKRKDEKRNRIPVERREYADTTSPIIRPTSSLRDLNKTPGSVPYFTCQSPRAVSPLLVAVLLLRI